MEIAEVQDKESLERYLRALPEGERWGVALRVAWRSAARVLPVAAREYAENAETRRVDETVVPVFGGVLIPLVAGLAPSVDTSSGTNARYPAALPVALPVSTAANAATSKAAKSAGYAANTSNATANADHAISYAAAETAAYAAEVVTSDTTDIWAYVRSDLVLSGGKLWLGTMPADLADDWQAAKELLARDPRADWSFWIEWYDRVLAGRNTYLAELAPILNKITREDWKKGPAHINPLFDDVLAMYRADDAASPDAENRDRPTNQVRAIQAQVSALQEFLEAEYLHLTGHNARSPEQDDILELLKELKALVADMITRLEGIVDNAGALIVVKENLPAVVERTGELAVIEEPLVVSPTVAMMSATIKSLVDAGADPKLATQIAMSEAASEKLMPRIWGLFTRKKSKSE